MCVLTAIVFGVFAVLFLILLPVLGIIWAVASVGIIAYLYSTWMQKNKRNFCADCGERIDYEEGVAWEVTEYNEKEISTNSGSQRKQVVKKRIATVEFTCTCSNCGATRVFTQNYDAVLWYDDGTVKRNNIESMAKNYFKI